MITAVVTMASITFMLALIDKYGSYVTKLWAAFIILQVLSLVLTMVGWVLLIPFCVTKAWTVSSLSGSDKDGRLIDHWNAGWLRFVYDNPEDGVSGRQAVVWQDGQQVAYLPYAPDWWRAYLWSAWRNSADGLKYRFKLVGGPFVRKEWRSFYFQAGWNSSGLPVLSMGRI